MTASTIFFMILIFGFYAGGFIFFLLKALKSEKTEPNN